jgi:hypothetical protein
MDTTVVSKIVGVGALKGLGGRLPLLAMRGFIVRDSSGRVPGIRT